MSNFIICQKTTNVVNAANQFFTEMVRLYGVLKTITSNHNAKFVSHFWRVPWKIFDTSLNFSRAYHPQSDGQTEIVNRTLALMIRGIVGDKPKAWDLALAQLYGESIQVTCPFRNSLY